MTTAKTLTDSLQEKVQQIELADNRNIMKSWLSKINYLCVSA